MVLLVCLILLYLLMNFVYAYLGSTIFYCDLVKEIEIKNNGRIIIKSVADFKYNNLVIILNWVLFPAYFFLLCYHSINDEYNHFTDGRKTKVISWLMDRKTK